MGSRGVSLEKILEVKQVNKTYSMDGNANYHVLKNIDLEVYEENLYRLWGLLVLGNRRYYIILVEWIKCHQEV